MRLTANIPKTNVPTEQLQATLKWLAFFHSPEGQELLVEFTKEDFDELEFDEMSKEKAHLLYNTLQLSLMFLQLVKAEPIVGAYFPTIFHSAFIHIVKGLTPYEKVLKYIAAGNDASAMEDKILGEMMAECELNDTYPLDAFKQSLKI